MEQPINRQIDTETIRHIAEIGMSCLNQAMLTHTNLGSRGTDSISKNQFGETALRADIEIEKDIIEILRKSGIPIRIYSEEHGIVDITPNPSLTGVLDGIDGSAEYKKFPKTGR